jgi:hypothetical protein
MSALALPVGAAQFDHVFCDAPYSPHVHKSASTMRGGVAKKRDLGFAHLSAQLRRHIAAHVAHANSWSLIHTDWEGLNTWRHSLTAAGAQYIRAIPWCRWSMPQLSGDRPPQGSECVIVAYGKKQGAKIWHGPGNLVSLEHETIPSSRQLFGVPDEGEISAVYHKCLRGEGKHGTEKPLDQMLDLVEWFSEPGEWIVDLTTGSGTAVVAALLLGRNSIGFDTDPEWAHPEAGKAVARVRGALQGILSDRDTERAQRYLVAKEARDVDAARRAAVTDKARARLAK